MNRTILFFWTGMLVLLATLFGRAWENPLGGFFVVTCIFPIILVLSYTYDRVLLPKYLEVNRIKKFILYASYSLILSLYAQIWIIILAFMYLANFQFEELAPSFRDYISICSTVYLMTLLGIFFLKSQRPKKVVSIPEKEQAVSIIVNRKSLSLNPSEIDYIESINGKTHLHLPSGNHIESREKLTQLNEKFPEYFLRVHRSFIVNQKHIIRHDASGIELKSGHNIPWGRAYRKTALSKMN